MGRSKSCRRATGCSSWMHKTGQIFPSHLKARCRFGPMSSSETSGVFAQCEMLGGVFGRNWLVLPVNLYSTWLLPRLCFICAVIVFLLGRVDTLNSCLDLR